MTTVAVDQQGSSSYTLDNGWQQAQRRLQLLEQCYDPGTIRRLGDLGVADGWGCLEVGAGGGSITRWLCDRVGPTGTVVAVDLDARFVNQIDADNLVVREADITTVDLPPDTFDLVHARALLMHLPHREAVLDRLVAALRPGGWLLVEEGDVFPIRSMGSGLYLEGAEAYCAAMTQAGVDLTWARRLPDLLGQRNLTAVTSVLDVPHFEGGSPHAELLALSGVQLRTLALSAGADAQHLDAWHDLVARPGRWFPGFAVVSVAGRRPAR